VVDGDPVIWDPFMFRDELDMLEVRLEAMEGHDVVHVLVEAETTHRGELKPLVFALNRDRFARWSDRIIHVVAVLSGDPDPWVDEGLQRDAAWPYIDAIAADADTVLVCDLDEIPSPALLAWTGPGVAAAQMRVFLFAVDWEMAGAPPSGAVATAAHVRQAGGSLTAVRAGRFGYPAVVAGAGHHMSWLGGPEAQRAKLERYSLHQHEIDARPEGQMIRDGTRYRTSESGGGGGVIPVDVDDSWPPPVAEHRCPESWFRPR
jgi:hypothetical protein